MERTPVKPPAGWHAAPTAVMLPEVPVLKLESPRGIITPVAEDTATMPLHPVTTLNKASKKALTCVGITSNRKRLPRLRNGDICHDKCRKRVGQQLNI